MLRLQPDGKPDIAIVVKNKQSGANLESLLVTVKRTKSSLLALGQLSGTAVMISIGYLPGFMQGRGKLIGDGLLVETANPAD